VSLTKLRPFIATSDWRPTALLDRADLRAQISPKVEQLELFAA
jgi:predicted DNA-binding helix-hairpin-helix protein